METERARHKRWAAQILGSDITPLAKVKELVALGYEESDAEAMVNNVQLSTNQVMFYEQLPDPEYDGK